MVAVSPSSPSAEGEILLFLVVIVMSAISDYLNSHFREVFADEFYRNIFPYGELEEEGVYITGKYTAIAVEITDTKVSKTKTYLDGTTKTVKVPKVNRYTITDELNNIDLLLHSKNFCILAPISYAGKTRDSVNARFMYALCIELDNLIVSDDGKQEGLVTLITQWSERVHWIPKPTYLVASGNGVHLYYLFEKPIPLFRNIVKSLTAYKRKLTQMIWNRHTTTDYTDEKIQQESVFQAFRMVGTPTKNGDITRAYEVGKRVSIDYMNSFLLSQDKKQCSIVEVCKTDLSLKKAKELYPEWYDRRIERNEPKGHWTVSRNVYDWWLNRIREEAVVGHRYYCLAMLSVYAIKCDISEDELEEDMFELLPLFEERTEKEDNHFSDKDVIDALQFFQDKGYVTYPINAISYKSGLHIEKNKRNGRKQSIHLQRARAVQQIDYPNGEWRNRDGRPNKQCVVYEWRKKHPNGTKSACKEDTGLSYPTIRKWWNNPPSRSIVVEIPEILRDEDFQKFLRENFDGHRNR